MQSLMNHQAETQKNQAAENAFVRKKVWGSDESSDSQSGEADDMGGGNIVLGDVQYPTPIVVGQSQQSSGSGLLKAVALTALGAAVPAAGLAGYAISEFMKDKPPIVEPIDNGQQDFSIGLGQIEDYLNK